MIKTYKLYLAIIKFVDFNNQAIIPFDLGEFLNCARGLNGEMLPEGKRSVNSYLQLAFSNSCATPPMQASNLRWETLAIDLD